ncbi:MAG TPA: CBS domain-containing protein, partial [Thermomicrobiales bacterium]|nr:CBS domain-containing protein [Thermomicrobiales bacterium]
DECLVVNDERVVVGRLRFDRLDAGPTETVEQIMEFGPTTIRPNEPLAKLTPRLQEKRVDRIVVATPDGRLVGVVARRDAAARLAAAPPPDPTGAG